MFQLLSYFIEVNLSICILELYVVSSINLVCGGDYFGSNGILRSPYYPSNYPRLRDCVYVISQPAGRGISLQFLDFDIEPGTDTSCFFDYLEVTKVLFVLLVFKS